MVDWALGNASTMTMAAGQGSLPWVELHERRSGRIFNVYIPVTLVGELTLVEFGTAVLDALAETQLGHELLALDWQQDHAVRWSSGDTAFSYIRFTRKA